ncbi:type II toxin-antitoxin system RelE/ParE family toxin [Chloroflexi bacterium TSY]|nr:type II toxin-antitoxin system RelE/ParE family toxin [Chloroflexi bacterium TSY]
MMRYQLEWPKHIRRLLRSLPTRLRREIVEVIQDLCEDPRPVDSEPLFRELTGLYRIRVDGWRVIYSIDEEDKVVKIETVRPRDENTYLNLP